MSRKIVLVIMILLFIAVPLTAQWKNIIEKNGPAIALVEIKDDTVLLSTGTAFLINKNGKLLTNAHVVKSAYYDSSKLIAIKFLYQNHSAEPFTAQITGFSRDLDIAILEIEGNFEQVCELGSSSDLSLMDEMLVAGYPLGKSFKAVSGYIQAFQQMNEIGKMIDISSTVDPGNSGGPVFNSEGKVIGIVTGKIWGLNFNLAIPVDTVNQFLLVSKDKRQLTITTDPVEARIYINNSYIGESPLTVDFYASEMLVTAESDGYVTTEESVSNDTEKILITLPEVESTGCELTIRTTPPGAEIYIDNRYEGISPVSISVEQDEKLRIRARKKRYKMHYEEYIVPEKAEAEMQMVLNR